MTNYVARYAHSDTDTPADLVLSAKTDAEAIEEIKKLVSDGYRNGTWANVGLSDGSVFACRNSHGAAVS